MTFYARDTDYIAKLNALGAGGSGATGATGATGVGATGATGFTGATGATGSGGGGTFVGCRAYNNATQSIANTGETAVAFNTESYDTSTFHDTSTNNSRFTVPTTGYYTATGFVFFANVAGGARNAYFKINGSTYTSGQATQLGDSTNGNYLEPILVDIALTAGDYIELIVAQNSAGAINIGHGSAASAQCALSIRKIG